MRRAILITAYDRPHLLNSTLESLDGVRGGHDWHLVISLDRPEHSSKRTMMREIATAWTDRWNSASRFASVSWTEQSVRQGVLRHPKVMLDLMLDRDSGFDYVLRLEDDMLFSDDLLEYHEWASQWGLDPMTRLLRFGFVESRSGAAGTPTMNAGGPKDIVFSSSFGSPLAIGTWPDVWNDVLSPTWDSDYSTHSGTPGVQSGWDWNLALRVYPTYMLHSIRPLLDKVFHTGVVGAHSTPDIYEVRPPLVPVPEPVLYTAAIVDEDGGERDQVRL